LIHKDFPASFPIDLRCAAQKLADEQFLRLFFDDFPTLEYRFRYAP